ncbi:hypothetical protein BJG94_02470 [Rhizobium sp. Td3]|nr:hypothetical protein BJG94_02470 [Rhizobium sp. Td3]
MVPYRSRRFGRARKASICAHAALFFSARSDCLGKKNAWNVKKSKTDKIVAIGLKRLKRVLCHCGTTDEGALQNKKECLIKSNADQDRHKAGRNRNGV